MNVIWVAVSALLGGLTAALLGWMDSAEPFAVRKFAASAVRALVAGIVFAVGYSYTNSLTPIDVGLGFLGGAGVDVLGNRISGAIKAGLK